MARTATSKHTEATRLIGEVRRAVARAQTALDAIEPFDVSDRLKSADGHGYWNTSDLGLFDIEEAKGLLAQADLKLHGFLESIGEAK